VIVTGDTSLKGKLKNFSSITESDHIDPMEATYHNQSLRSTKPFTFEFNSQQLKLSNVVLLSDTKTQMNLKKTINLANKAKLTLTVTDQVPPSLLAPNPS